MSTDNESAESVELDLFRTVQSNPDVCGNCFRRTHNTYDRNYAIDVVKVDDFEWEPYPRKVELPSRSFPVYENRKAVPEDPAAHGLRRNCACGYPAGEQLRPLPKRLFFSYAENLFDRYLELGVEVDRERFFDALKSLKTDPAEQFADDRLFEKATRQALEES